jgi:hypothetical protein
MIGARALPCRSPVTSLARVAIVAFALHVSAGLASAQNARGMPEDFEFQPRDLTRELANKMSGTYVVAATGDILLQEAAINSIDPRIGELLRGAHTTVGNMEATLIDRRNWTHGYGGNWAPKELARQVADLGYDMLTGANNHTWDMGEEGVRSSMHWLAEVGIPLAGVGPNLTVARQPVFQHLPQGRVALVGAYPVSGNATIASGEDGDGGWGINPLRLSVWNVVEAQHLRQLKGIRDAIVARRTEPDVSRPIRVPADDPNRVTIFGDNYMLGPKTGEYHYEMNPADRRAQVLAVRNAKEYADFAMFTMHVHQNRYAFQAYSQDHYPNQYLIDLTHEMVDNGMDMYVGHGNHTMQGVEIYKGRPIFYNLGNFAVQRWGIDDSGSAGRETSIEASEAGGQWLQQPENLSALVATSRYEDGKLTEVRLYPVDLGIGQTRPWSQMSIPQWPSPAVAKQILERVQEYSRPFGTVISIENGVGVIRVPASATVPVGAELRSRLSAQP